MDKDIIVEQKVVHALEELNGMVLLVSLVEMEGFGMHHLEHVFVLQELNGIKIFVQL